MSETTPEAPATDAPGAKIFICPACGTRYDEPTECANGHLPTQTVEYDRATVEAADGGDESAIASVAKTEADAIAGTSPGAVDSEAAPLVPVETPAAPAAADETVTEATPVDPVPPPAADEPAAPAADAAAPAADETAAEAPAGESSIGSILAHAAVAVEDAAAAIRAAITAANGS